MIGTTDEKADERLETGSSVIEPPDFEPRSILVPLDGSARAARAVLPARRLAAALGLATGVITVAGPRTGLDGPSLESLRVKHRLHWADVVQSSSAAAGIVTVACERGAMIVMATGNRSNVGVGSTASAVLNHAGHPVVLVGPCTDISDRRPVQELVVAVSGSTSGETACEAAAGLARTYGFDLRFVTVVQPATEPAERRQPAARKPGTAGDEHGYMADLVGRYRSTELRVEGSVISDPVSPAGGLARMMRHRPQSLLVLSPGGLTARPRHDGVAARIVGESPVPAIMLPTDPAGRAGAS